MKKTKKKKEVIEIENWNLVMALGSCKMKRGIETPESWVLCKTRVAFQKHLRLNQIAVPRRRHQPLAGSRTPKWIPHHTHCHSRTTSKPPHNLQLIRIRVTLTQLQTSALSNIWLPTQQCHYSANNQPSPYPPNHQFICLEKTPTWSWFWRG